MAECSTCGTSLSEPSAVCPVCLGATQSALTVTASPSSGLPATVAQVRPGDLLEGKWEVQGEIGKGGMGVVMLAKDVALDRRVAIKLLADSLATDELARQRFEREARLTASLEHPNIVLVYGVGAHQGRPFIVMKYLEGMPLSKYLKTVPLPLRLAEVRSIVHALCAGLEFLHERSLVHRDLKPGNVFIGPSGHVTLLDFGLSRPHGASELTRAGKVLGTLKHMSPEQLRGEPVDARSDIYALGLVVYELVSGAHPFDGIKTIEDALRTLGGPPPPLKERAPWAPPALGPVLDRALQRDPSARFQSVRQFAAAFEGATRASETLPPTKVGPPPRRPLLVPITAALGALGLVGLLAGALLVARRPAPETKAAAPPPAPVVAVGGTPPATPLAPEAAQPAPTQPPQLAPEAPIVAPLSASEPRSTRARHAASGSGKLNVVTYDQGRPTWATLKIDGQKRGGTPVALELPVGKHRVVVEREGFRSIAKDVEIVRGHSDVLRIDLTR